MSSTQGHPVQIHVLYQHVFIKSQPSHTDQVGHPVVLSSTEDISIAVILPGAEQNMFLDACIFHRLRVLYP